MTLVEQIREISTRWFNADFAREIPIPRQVTALATEAFRKMQHVSAFPHHSALPYEVANTRDIRAIKLALDLVDACNLRNDTQAVD